MQVSNSVFSDLLPDLQLEIFKQLETPVQIKIRRVCRGWRANIDDMLNRPSHLDKAKKFAATLFLRQHILVNEPWVEDVRNLQDKQQSEDLLARMERTKKKLLTDGVDLLVQDLSLQELIGVIQLQKLQAFQNFQCFLTIRTLLSSEDVGEGSEQEIEPSHREVALQIVSKVFASVVGVSEELGIDVDEEDEVKDMQLEIEPLCRRFSLGELQDIRKLFDSPSVSTAIKIGALIGDLDSHSPAG